MVNQKAREARLERGRIKLIQGANERPTAVMNILGKDFLGTIINSKLVSWA